MTYGAVWGKPDSGTSHKNRIGTILYHDREHIVNHVDEALVLESLADRWQGEIAEALEGNASRKKIREIDDHYCRMINRFQLVWAIRKGDMKLKTYYLKQMTDLSCGKPASVTGGDGGGKNRGVVELPARDKGGEDE